MEANEHRKLMILRQMREDANWEESDHPRDENGRFSKGSGRGGAKRNISEEDKTIAQKHGIPIDTTKRSAKQDGDWKNINPQYESGKKEFRLNCGNCSIAYELKRRGMDVQASARKWMYPSEFSSLFNGFRWGEIKERRKETAKKELNESLTLMGDGARGIIFSEWDGRRTGHFFNFEVEDGKVVFIDGQSDNNADEYLDYMKPSKIMYARTDNKKINDSIFKCVEVRKHGDNSK